MSLKHYNITKLFRFGVASLMLFAMIIGTLPVSHTTNHAGHNHHDENNLMIEISDKKNDDCNENSTHQHISANEHGIGFLVTASSWQHRVSMTKRLPMFAELYSDQDFLYEHERPPREYSFI
jgi:hypothetical protein